MSIAAPNKTAITTDQNDSSTLDSWENLRKLEPGRRIAVYLENSGRMVQRFQAVTDSRLILDIDGIEREKIVAVALAPKDKMRDGVLVGSGIGTSIGAGSGAAHSRSITAITSVYGLGIGAGIGALLDSGFATPEKPIYLRGGSGTAQTSVKRWTLKVPGSQLARWIVGRKLEMMLRDGTYLKGKVVRGVDQGVELAVADSSEKKLKGRKVEIASNRISTLTYRENVGGNRFAAALGGGILGLLTGTIWGATVNGSTDETQLVVAAGVGTLVGSAMGLGAAEHKNWREITLIIQ